MCIIQQELRYLIKKVKAKIKIIIAKNSIQIIFRLME